MNFTIKSLYKSFVSYNVINFIAAYSLGESFNFLNKTRIFYYNKVLHRQGGPAIEYVDGEKRWYYNGICHREDGPAIEYANGRKTWVIKGMALTEKEFNDKIQKLRTERKSNG